MSCVMSFQNIIDYCEEQLNENITIEELASKAGYSLFYFCRLFQSAISCAPKEYLRKRRLTQAAIELYNTKEYIKDIGYKWGFNSHENFVRAFKKQFAVSPSQYRETKSSLNLFHRTEKVDSLICEDLGLKPEIIEKPSFKLAGFNCWKSWKDNSDPMIIPKLWNRYHADRLYDKIGRASDPVTRWDIGLTTGYDFENSGFSYTIGLKIDDFEGINKECTKKIVPSALYAVFKTPSADTHTFVKNIHATHRYIYQVWMPRSGYVHTGTHEFETYCEASYSFSEEIWIPVVRRV